MFNKLKSLFGKKTAVPANFEQASKVVLAKNQTHLVLNGLFKGIDRDQQIYCPAGAAMTNRNLVAQIDKAMFELNDYPELQTQLAIKMVEAKAMMDRLINMQNAIEPVVNMIAIETMTRNWDKTKETEALEINWFKG
ncbi:hypothetical protein [Shewanella sp. UCD-KL12]|uniref:hypothetical protein n=1 Tax=Shewanella sp. UCD-KL12 TaxID=1917163 RepID=UPI0009704364|nr:hypothetical protein [Shewanella sp. UCD-KL12]